MNDTVSQKLKLLPDSPGCYLMRDGQEIIYVGKAVNLKNRVRSYFHGDHTPKVAAMAARVTDFDIVLCRTNLEALILECNLIKLHKPYYNILLKDDKHYPYIRLDLTEPFPRVTLARRLQKDKARYFGPYIGATAVRDVLDTLRKTFPIRACALSLPLKTPARPCVNYEMGHCLAPCALKCTPEEYAQVIHQVMKFLSGKYDDVLNDLRAKMQKAADSYQYERAAGFRDRVRDIEGLMQRQQAIQVDGADQDVIGLATDAIDAMAEVMYVRGGKIVGADSFALAGEGGESRADILFGFLLQYYDERKPPREVLCPAMEEEIIEDLTQWLREKRGAACTLSVPQRGDKRALTLLAEKNARDALEKRNAKQQVKLERTVGACEKLGKALGMEKTPRRIEGFDISNTQGVLSVASMVVFIDGEPAKQEYRHYRIKTVEGANDFASMNEVLYRRFLRAVSDDPKEKWATPDLVLIDGGPEQLAFARRAMLDAGANVPMFGLAKRLEEIYLPDREQPIVLSHHTPELQLVQRIRDEAHRFAITHHKMLRGNASVHSQLEDIPGIGLKRRRALLKAFQSIKAIKEADADALAAVEGMTRPAAEAVYRWSHPETPVPDGN